MRFDAIVLDFGNTLAPWGEGQGEALYRAIARTVAAHVGEPIPDFEARARATRAALVGRRETTTMREVTVEELCEHFFRGRTPAGLPEVVARTIHESFLALCRVPPHVPPLVERLARTRPLAVLSNFLLASPVEEVLRRDGVAGHLVHIEVSATRGWMKPHPEPFEVVRERLGTPMERTLMVGDDFWCDIVGGNRAGFLTALTREYVRGPDSHPGAPDVRPDLVLDRLDELH